MRGPRRLEGAVGHEPKQNSFVGRLTDGFVTLAAEAACNRSCFERIDCQYCFASFFSQELVPEASSSDDASDNGAPGLDDSSMTGDSWIPMGFKLLAGVFQGSVKQRADAAAEVEFGARSSDSTKRRDEACNCWEPPNDGVVNGGFSWEPPNNGVWIAVVAGVLLLAAAVCKDVFVRVRSLSLFIAA